MYEERERERERFISNMRRTTYNKRYDAMAGCQYTGKRPSTLAVHNKTIQ